MLINNRIIWNDNSTLKDLSISLNNIFANDETIALVAADDKLYLGSDFPFNHRYFKVATANDQASVITAEIWNGSDWEDAVDVIDQTKDSTGAYTLSQSGIISWVLDRNKCWGNNSSTELMTGSGLTTLKIYDLYWVRLTFSGDLKATTALTYVGHKFSTDNDLAGYYPDLNRSTVKSAFSSGKTTWDEQHVLAAEEIIRDLRKKGIIFSRNQIFGWEEFTDAAIHKVAEIAFAAFGEAYEKRKESAREAYDEAMDKITFGGIDKDIDGRLSAHEKLPAHGRLIRG